MAAGSACCAGVVVEGAAGADFADWACSLVVFWSRGALDDPTGCRDAQKQQGECEEGHAEADAGAGGGVWDDACGNEGAKDEAGGSPDEGA